MAQTFSFGFSNDDIEDGSDNDEPMDVEKPPSTLGPAELAESELVKPRRHTLQELVRRFRLLVNVKYLLFVVLEEYPAVARIFCWMCCWCQILDTHAACFSENSG